MSSLAVSLIGKTVGLEAITFPKETTTPDFSWVTPAADEMALEGGADVYLLRRLWERGRCTTWIGLYRKSYEIGARREGGFFGAGIWLFDSVAGGRNVLALLQHLAGLVARHAIRDGAFVARLSDVERSLNLHEVKASLINPLHASLRPLSLPPGMQDPGGQSTLWVALAPDGDGSLPLHWLLDWLQAEPEFLGMTSRVVVGPTREALGRRGHGAVTMLELVTMQAAQRLEAARVLHGLDAELTKHHQMLQEARCAAALETSQLTAQRDTLRRDLRQLVISAEQGLRQVHEPLKLLERLLDDQTIPEHSLAHPAERPWNSRPEAPTQASGGRVPAPANTRIDLVPGPATARAAPRQPGGASRQLGRSATVDERRTEDLVSSAGRVRSSIDPYVSSAGDSGATRSAQSAETDSWYSDPMLLTLVAICALVACALVLLWWWLT